MQIFGQVWLWSLGSFLLGVLFTWLLLVKPARKRVVELEDAALGTPQPATRVGPPVSEAPEQPGPNKTDRFLDDLFESQRPPQVPAHQPPPVMPPPPLPPAPAMPAVAAPPGPTAPPEPPIPDESDTELSEAPFQQFTHSTTVFVPPANLPQPPEAAGNGEDWFSKEDEADPHAITDVEDDERVDDRGTIFTQHTTPIPAEMIRSLDESQPEQARHELPDEETPEQFDQELEPSEFEEASQQVDTVPESAAEVTQHFEPAQVEQYAHAGAHQAEQFEAPAESGRSLFEPVVPVPVGEREAASDDDFVPPGPFGPGSAMPLPGGGAPAPDFNVKASVTALRYCTQDNPQFDRIVAEVWFRTPSDAERVGFRVLS